MCVCVCACVYNHTQVSEKLSPEAVNTIMMRRIRQNVYFGTESREEKKRQGGGVGGEEEMTDNTHAHTHKHEQTPEL